MSPQENEQTRRRRELRRRMATQKGIDRAMNNVLEGMQQLVDQSQIAKSRMEKAQIKNLLAVALEAGSVEVVKKFVTYQAGRDVAGSSWRKGGFFQALIDALDGLKGQAGRITRQAHTDLRLAEPDEEQVDEAWMLLVRAYLGQLNRYFYYRKEETRWPQATH